MSMAKAELAVTLKKAKLASPLLISAAGLKPKAGTMTLGAAVKLDKEVQDDLFEWKRGEPLAKVIKHLGGVLKHLDLLEEAMKAVPEEVSIHEEQSCVPIEAAAFEPDAEPFKEEWTDTPITPVQKGRKKSSTAASPTKSSRSQDEKVSKATAFTQAAKCSLYLWCWNTAPLLVTVYAQMGKFAMALPAIGLNLVLGLGVAIVILFLCNPEDVGEYLGDFVFAIPSWLGTWGAGVLRGMKRTRASPCPQCPACQIPARCLDLGNSSDWVPAPGPWPQEPANPPTAPPIDLATSSFVGALLAIIGGRFWGATGPGHH